MNLYNQNINREILLKLLSKGNCKVTFVKSNNTTRTMLCTLNSDSLPGKYTKTLTSVLSENSNPDILPVWDVENGGWRSFKLSSVLVFKTIEEEQKSGHEIISEQTQKLDTKKKNIKSSFDERVLQQKLKTEENRKNAKIIIDNIRNKRTQKIEERDI